MNRDMWLSKVEQFRAEIRRQEAALAAAGDAAERARLAADIDLLNERMRGILAYL